MRIVVGSDHAGFALKQEVAECLRRDGHEVLFCDVDAEHVGAMNARGIGPRATERR